MTNEDAARTLRELAFRMRLSMDGDEGVDSWTNELERIANSLEDNPELHSVKLELAAEKHAHRKDNEHLLARIASGKEEK